jgi:excisionase family DNA binding protein
MTSRLILNVDQLTEYLQVKRSWVYDMVYKQKLPHYKLGKLLRFDLDEIEAWLSNQHAGPDLRTEYSNET